MCSGSLQVSQENKMIYISVEGQSPLAPILFLCYNCHCLLFMTESDFLYVNFILGSQGKNIQKNSTKDHLIFHLISEFHLFLVIDSLLKIELWPAQDCVENTLLYRDNFLRLALKLRIVCQTIVCGVLCFLNTVSCSLGFFACQHC